jgi:predicted kinase
MMKRLLILTVGKTHSGKSTFANALEKKLPNSVVVDQDNHAEFLHTYYQQLVPYQGPNKIKYALTRTVVDYVLDETNCHLILCNSNRNHNGRLKLLEEFHNKGFTTIIVNFNIPHEVLRDRIGRSKRSTTVIRTASTFEDVLTMQLTDKSDGTVAKEGEADYLFEIRESEGMKSVIEEIVSICEE